MAGSNTARTGIESYGSVSPEVEADFKKPAKKPGLSYWVIPDSRGVLKGMLHFFRRFEYCRDVIVLVSKTTPADYLEYLKKREYDFIVAGEERVDYNGAFGALAAKYNVRRILVDSGPGLGGVLLGKGLVDEISLLIHPGLAGKTAPGLFESLELGGSNIELRPVRQEIIEDKYLWVVWRVKKGNNI